MPAARRFRTPRREERDVETNRARRLSIIAALIGIVVELSAIALLASGRISYPTALPLIIVGMFLAFIPIFVFTRRRR